jgi:hypothetical protein
LLRAKGGGFGEAMEAFRRAGVGANEFRAQGININNGGQVMSTAEDFLAAIKNISEGKLKSIADQISGGAETTISNAGDAIGRAFRQVGKVLNDEFLPVIAQMTEGIGNFATDGGFKLVTEALFGVGISASGTEDALTHFGAQLVRLPKIIETLGTGFKMLGDAVVWLIKKILDPTGQGENIANWIKDHTNGKVGQGIIDTSDFWAGLAPAFNDLMGGIEAANFYDTMEQRKKGRLTKTAKDPELPDNGQPTKQDQIADYTRRTAEATEKQLEVYKSALGGGNNAKYATSAVNLSRAGKSGDAIDRGIRGLADAIREEIFGNQLVQARNGYR